ncbi:bifunctional 6-Cysteine (6-Cys) domain/6-Cysteine (6-Cys) domain superfamily [Babesia duncani]|uniref:Bifunctional 6-Cysteine (6-Cys) domain/6-Cysteine (6-Cys) domain superfamily n=1 Tax=Babesia duncani TaxID=323732 RepID=A0AAD9UNB1_9APIC|nr:bifunctional 6-Cysteine (6-Cys) domain/6-Cysteine (6-Cys) domain superfamily [Babesia duncani]
MVDPVTILGFITLILSNVTNADLDVCDFSGEGILEPGKITLCKGKIGVGRTTEIICPKILKGSGYDLFPNTAANEAYAYHYPNGRLDIDAELRPTDYKYIYGSIHQGYVNFELDGNVVKLAFRFPVDEWLVSHGADKFLYLCMSPDTKVDNDFLELIKWHIINGTRMALDAEEKYQMIHEISSELVNKGIGIVEMTSLAYPTVAHGCGDVPTNLFLNKADYDTETQSYSCEIDIMNRSNVGFFCTGKLDPPSCLYRLYDMENELFTNIDVRHVYNYGDLLYASFKEIRGAKEFYGKCYCRNAKTNEITATIVFKHRTEHLCDLNYFLKNGNPKSLPDKWCHFKMNVGESATILFPPETDYYTQGTDAVTTGESQEAFYTSTLVPKDIKSNCYWRVESSTIHPQYGALNQILGPGAIEVDDTDRANGKIVINYKKKLDSKFGDSNVELVYYWHLHYRGTPMSDDTRASVLITLVCYNDNRPCTQM